jgi:hypothetical protein
MPLVLPRDPQPGRWRHGCGPVTRAGGLRALRSIERERQADDQLVAIVLERQAGDARGIPWDIPARECHQRSGMTGGRVTQRDPDPTCAQVDAQ